ncbi:MAG: Mini-ribonuclease 3 [Saccharofermentanales bacterium]|nr:ribonuclease III domain-containing protein [Bacillota bacterium]
MEAFQLEHQPITCDLREMPISTLAWIGDSVFDLHVRMALAGQQSACNSGDLHRAAVRIVSAAAQAEALGKLMPLLDQEEAALIRRARNHDPGSLPRHADPIQYRHATALEALIGYHYLAHNRERLTELMNLILSDNAT